MVDKSTIWFDLDELVVWKDNYNEGDVGAIALSIRRYGFANDPRVGKNKNIWGGNHTVMALRQIKQVGALPAVDREFPPRRVQVKGDSWLIPCADISYLDEQEAIAFAIADNRMAQKASQDEQRLLAYLLQLRDTPGIVLDSTGFDPEDIAEMEALLRPVNAPSFAPDQKDSKDIYDAGMVKQIVLYYGAEEYNEVIKQFLTIMKNEHLESNTDVVGFLLRQYENLRTTPA